MNSMSQYLGRIYLAINPYENHVPFFDKEFISPASNTALAFYKYTILDFCPTSIQTLLVLCFANN